MLIYLLCDTAVALILYELLKPVSRSLSLLASFFRLAMVAILGANLLNLFAPLVLLTGAPLSTSFKARPAPSHQIELTGVLPALAYNAPPTSARFKSPELPGGG